jgi:hypothetical protein
VLAQLTEIRESSWVESQTPVETLRSRIA